MLLSIALKEFLNNLVSARFMVGFLLCLFLIPFTLLVNIDDFNEQFRIHTFEKERAEKEFKSVHVYSQLRPEIIKSPEPLGVFSNGISKNVGNKVKIWLGEKPFFAEEKLQGFEIPSRLQSHFGQGNPLERDNPLLNSFFSTDFAGILASLLSLFALIFTYDSFTGEKERGTLKLLTANSINRHTILLGKVLGIYLTITPILFFCYLLVILFTLLFYNVSFSMNEWARILLLFASSIVYFSVFLFIGLFISSHMHSSRISIIICLFAWVIFVFIIPNLSYYAVDTMVSVQSLDNLDAVLNDLDEEFRKSHKEYQDTLEPLDTGSGWIWGSTGWWDLTTEYIAATKSRMERDRKIVAHCVPLLIDYADKKWIFQEAYLKNIERQRRIAETFSLISPSEIFKLICSMICRTDANSHFEFMESARRYREEFINYLKDRNAFSSYLYFTPVGPENFKTSEEFKKLREKGGFKPAGMETYPFLDLSGAPVFQWHSEGVFLHIRNILMKIVALVITCIILFWLSFAAFANYDVR